MIRNVVQIGAVEHLHIDRCCASSDLHQGRHRSRWGRTRPLDLVKLRSWIAEITAQYRDSRSEQPKWHVDWSPDLADAYAETDDSPRRLSNSMIRRLAVAGIANYLTRVDELPSGAIPEWIMLDLLVFGMWPIITARRLPAGWQSDLAALTSPRVAVLVDRARVSMRGGADYAAEEFASAVARKDYLFAIVNLFEDLAGEGAAQLTAMAIAGEIENPRVYGRKERFLWAVGIASGGVVLGEIAHHGQAIAEFAADLFEDPDPPPARTGDDSTSGDSGSDSGYDGGGYDGGGPDGDSGGD